MGRALHDGRRLFYFSEVKAIVLARKHSLAILWGVCALAVAIVFLVPPVPQSSDYHNFVDARTLLSVPNFWNVISNVSFLVVGLIGVALVLRGDYGGGLPSLRVAYGIFFLGISAVCFGSGYYHWAPSNATLVWDRLPMSIAFMAFLSIVVGEHIDERVAKRSLLPLLAIGALSVWYWRYTEGMGHGDLRFYGLVQFLSLLLIALIWVLFPSQLTGIGYLWGMFAGYALAKILEEFDSPVYAAFGNKMSGHALKHFAAAAGMYSFVLALQRRRLRESSK